MNIGKMTILELKSLGFDMMLEKYKVEKSLEFLQNNLDFVLKRISELQKIEESEEKDKKED